MLSLSNAGSLAGILLAAVVGALPPLLGRWSDRQLHLFVAFGAGVFLGAVFFHLIPETMAAQRDVLTDFMILNGFMVVLFVERVLVRHRHHDCDDMAEHRHQVVGISAFIGLSIHSLMAGFALGASFVAPRIALVIFLAIVSHKSVAAFSLATIFRLSNIPLKRALVMLAVFALCTPVGALLSLPLLNTLSEIHITIPTALAAGTFIYVATMDLLPEAFHDTRKRFGPFVALSIGIFVMMLITRIGG
ncbi:MAG: ZIP family metal transporter [Fidelibacterota bacterium]|nr:MAG: ZIP family metal transporter [Candidatus Neomarinimicrobiota bacterium]